MPRRRDDEAKQRNRLAQQRWRERLRADPERYEEHKRKARRRQRIYVQQNQEYAERRLSQYKERYAADSDFRARSKARNSTPAELQRRRALQCLKRGDLKHLPDQLRIIKERAERLLKEIDETLP